MNGLTFAEHKAITGLAMLLLAAMTAWGAMTNGAEVGGRNEGRWVARWCSERVGSQEFVLPDHTRVDCLTDRYAIEFDFADKWAEAIGQALYYGAATQRQPGVVLIVQGQGECRHVNRLRTVVTAHRLPIQLWTTPVECPL